MMKEILVVCVLISVYSRAGRFGYIFRLVWLGLGTVISGLSVYRSSVVPVWVVSPGMYSIPISSWLVSLTFWVGCLAMAASVKSAGTGPVLRVWAFGSMVGVSCFLVSLAFTLSSMFWFYVFFEASLVPMFLLIMGWGSYEERVQASSYLVLYTVAASLPFLLVMSSAFPTFMKCVDLVDINVTLGTGPALYYSCLMAFLVKLPVYPFHLWLPKAHVEAPVAGSMILAGVLLKLGGFGLMSSLWFFSGSLGSSHLGMSVCSLVGGVLASIACLRQSDLKAAVAYSSVAHMSLVAASAFSLTSWGWAGCSVIMVSHGLTSSGLFCLINEIFEKTGSRSMLMVHGLMVGGRPMAFWGLVFFSANIPTPPWLSVVGEVVSMPGLVAVSEGVYLLMFFLLFLSGVYNLLIYTSLFHGASSSCLVGRAWSVGPGDVCLLGHFFPLLGLVAVTDKIF